MTEDSKPPLEPTEEEIAACREWRKRKRTTFLSRSPDYQCAAYASYKTQELQQLVDTLRKSVRRLYEGREGEGF